MSAHQSSQAFHSRRLLSGTTALLVVWSLSGVVYGQSLPVGPVTTDPASPSPTAPGFATGADTMDGTGNMMTVTLNDTRTVIDWTSFNIDTGNRVHFANGTGGTTTRGVLNRVVGASASDIKGDISSPSNIAVWLLNPNGVVFGANSAVNTGSFFVSTMGMTNTDFLDGDATYSLSTPTSSAITMNGDVTVGGTIGVLGQTITANGNLESTGGDIALVAAKDVVLSFAQGSPLGVQITAGTTLGAATVNVDGTLKANSIVIAGASDVTGALLNVQSDADLQAIEVGGRIILSMGTDFVDPATPPRTRAEVDFTTAVTNGDITSTGALTAKGDIELAAPGDISQTGNVTADGNYTIAGQAITLGGTQGAKGTVTITGDGITGAGTLTSDSDDSGSEDLTLNSTGAINMTTALKGGASKASAVVISAANQDVTLGTVDAKALTGLETQAGNIALGAVSVATDLNLRAMTGKSVSIASITTDNPSGTANATVRGGTTVTVGGLTAIDGNYSLTADTGAVTLNGIQGAKGTVTVTGVGINTNTGIAGPRSLTADSDTSGGENLMLDGTTGTINMPTELVAGGDITATTTGAVTLTGDVTAGGKYEVSGATIAIGGTQKAKGSIKLQGTTMSGAGELTSNSDDTGTETLTLKATGAINMTTALKGGATKKSDVVIDAAGQDVTLGRIDAKALTGLETQAGNIALGAVSVTADLNLRAMTGKSVSIASIATDNPSGTANATVRGGTTVTVGGLTAIDGNYSLTADTGAVTLNGIQGAKGTVTVTGVGITGDAGSSLRADSDTSGGENLTLDGTTGVINLPTTLSAGGDITASTTGAVTLTGDVTAGGNYEVTGAAITIGGTQAAKGAVTLDGTTLSGSGTLTANSDGTGAEALTLNSTGAINMTTALNGGTTGQKSNVAVSAANQNVTLGNVTAAALTGLATQAGNIALSEISVTNNLTLRSTNGSVSFTKLTTDDGGVGSADASVRSFAALTVNAPVAVDGNYSLTSDTGAVTLGGIQAAKGSVSVTGVGIASTGSGNSLRADSDTTGAEALSLDATTGTINMTTVLSAGGDVTAVAAGSVSLTGNVTAGGDYEVTGAGITIGGTQAAKGAVMLDGTKLEGSGTLTSNSDNTGGEALTLKASSGGIDMTTALNGGTTQKSNVVIDAANQDVTLGNVNALGLTGLNAQAGNIVTGDVSVDSLLELESTTGSIFTGALTTTSGKDATLKALSTVMTQGAASIGGDYEVTAGGNIRLDGTTDAQGNVTLDGDDVTFGNVEADGDISITAVGDVGGVSSSPDLTANGADSRIIVQAGGEVVLDNVTAGSSAAASLPAATAQIDIRGQAIIAEAIEAKNLSIILETTNGNVEATSVTAKQNVTILADTTGAPAGISIDTVTGTDGDVSLTANNGALSGRSVARIATTAGNDLTLQSSDAIDADTLEATHDLSVTSTAGSVTITSATAGRHATVTAETSADIGSLEATTGDLTVTAGNAVSSTNGGIDITTATAGGNVMLSARNDDIAAGTVTADGDVTIENTDRGGTSGNIRAGSVSAVHGNIRMAAVEDITGTAAIGSPTSIDDFNRGTVTSGTLNDATTKDKTIVIESTGGRVKLAAVTAGDGPATASMGLTQITITGLGVDVTSVTARDGGVELTATDAGNDLSAGTVLAADSIDMQSARDVRTNSVTSSGGDITVTAARHVNGTGGTSTAAAMTASGEGKTITVTATAGTARLGDLTAGSGAPSATLVADQIVVTAETIDFDTAKAWARDGELSLQATAGDLILGTGEARSNTALTASDNVQLDTLTAHEGNALVTATNGNVTGLTASHADIMAGNDLQVTSGLDSRLNVLSAGRNIEIAASGDAEVIGDVTAGSSVSGGGYDVRGQSVTLGKTASGAVNQKATGLVRVVASSGDVTGRGDLTVTSDSGTTVHGAPVLLEAANGAIVFGSGTTIQGGANRTGRLGIMAGAGQDVTLGTVNARAIDGLTGAPGSETFAAGLMTSGDISTGTVSVRNGLTLKTTAGDITTGGITISGAGQGLALEASGDITATADLSAQGNLAVAAGGNALLADVRSHNGNVDLDAVGNLSSDVTIARGRVGQTASGSVTATTVTGGSTGTAGDATDPGAGATAAVAGTLVLPTGSAAATPAGDAAPTSSDVTLTAGTFADIGTVTGANISVTAGTNADVDMADASGDLLIDAGDDATLGTGTATGTGKVLAGGNATVTALLDSDGDATVDAGLKADVASVNGADVSVTAGTDAEVDLADATGDLLIDATDNAVLDTGTAAGAAQVKAGNNATITTKLVAASATLTAGNAASATRIDGTATTVAVKGKSVNVTTTEAKTALALEATDGDLELGTGTAGTSATVTANGNADLTTLTAGSSADIDATLLAIVGSVSGTDVSVTAGSADVTSATASASLVVDASGGAFLGSGTAGTTAVVSAGDDATVNSLAAVGNATIMAGTFADAGSVSGMNVSVTATHNDAEVDTALAVGNLIVGAGGNATLGAGTAGGTGEVLAVGDAIVTALHAGGDVSVTAGSTADVATVTGANITVKAAIAAEVDSAAATGNLLVEANEDATLGTGTAGGTGTVKGGTNATITTKLAANGDALLTAGDTAKAAEITSTTGKVAVKGKSADVTKAEAKTTLDIEATAGNLALGTGKSGGAANAKASGNATVATLEAGGAATVQAGATGNVVSVSGSSVSVTGASADVGTATAGGSLLVQATDDARLGTGTAGGTGEVKAGNDATITTSLTADAASLTAGRTAKAARIKSTGSAIAVKGRSAEVTEAEAKTTLAVEATNGDVTLGKGAAGTTSDLKSTGNTTIQVFLKGGGTATVAAGESVQAAEITTTGATSDVLVTGKTLSATTANAGGMLKLTSSTGGVTLGTGTAGGTATLEATGTTGDIAVTGGLTAKGVTIKSPGAVQLAATTSTGDVSVTATTTLQTQGIAAAGQAVKIDAANADITGDITGKTITVAARANMRLGSSATGAAGFDLSEAEINHLKASGTGSMVALDAGNKDVAIGDLNWTLTDPGTTAAIFTTGRVDLTGRLATDASGGTSGSATTRTLILGGSATDAAAQASVIRVVATSSAGGRIDVGGGALDLRGGAIAVGQAEAFLDEIGVNAGATPLNADAVAATYVNQPNSTLYRSRLPYTDPLLVRAGSIKLKYKSFALFQNSGAGVVTKGTSIGSAATPGTIEIDPIAPPNAFAMFGDINGVSGSASALLGANVIKVGAGASVQNTRVNGCVVGAATACLSSSLVQPPLNVFDNSNMTILTTAAPDLSFDSVLSSNNEALFSDIAAPASSLSDDANCDPATQQCPAEKGTN